jgi:5-methylcytosine-specific restriction enzyme subunit McrC
LNTLSDFKNEYIKNIFYIFLYSLNKFNEGKLLKLSLEERPKDLPNLFALILNKIIRIIIKKGLHRDYKEKTLQERFVRGKINFKKNIQNHTFKDHKVIKKIYCIYSELSEDTALNKIIKLTLLNLLKNTYLDSDTRKQIRPLLRSFENVQVNENIKKYLSQVTFSQSNNHYKLCIGLCKILDECMVPTQEGGKFLFKNIFENEKQMGIIFEKFVFNFLQINLKDKFEIKAKELSWSFKPIDKSNTNYVPKMRTDIVLRHKVNKNRVIIIDTKFYKEKNILSRYKGAESFNANNLYQITSYITNMKNQEGKNVNLEGILLYAQNSNDIILDEKYKWMDHTVTIKTVNLNQEWKNIEEDLLKLCV